MSFFKFSFFILCLSILSAGVVHSAQSPMKQTLAMVEAMKAVKNNSEAEFTRIDKFIDYETITTATIAPHRTKFTDQQAAHFKKNLRELIRLVAYPDSGEFLRISKHTYQKPIKKGDVTIVIDEVFEPKEDLELEVGYFWKKKKGEWVMVDLTFDDDSIVKDYQNQFGRIIAKDGVKGLIKKLDEKLAEKKK